MLPSANTDDNQRGHLGDKVASKCDKGGDGGWGWCPCPITDLLNAFFDAQILNVRIADLNQRISALLF
jgi:hypothetical protein